MNQCLLTLIMAYLFLFSRISGMAMEETNTFRGKKFSRMKQFLVNFLCFNADLDVL